MDTAQKIYYNNKPLILTDNGPAYIERHAIAKGFEFYTGAFPRNFRLAFEHLDKLRTLGVIIEDHSVTALWQELEKIYQPIDAGGGVVVNENGGVLMIYRRGKWDLPKGKLEKGCAVLHHDGEPHGHDPRALARPDGDHRARRLH